MNVPNFIHDKFVDENGYLTDGWRLFFNQLINEMNENLSQEGIVMPSQTTANADIIKTDALNGTILYDSTTNELKVRLNDGNFHVIQTV